MLTIRLTRKGKKNQPFFRVVVIDKRRSSKGGRSVEDLGYVNPLTKKLSLNKERIQYWLKTGAQPSDTIHNLLVKEKIIDAKKVHVSKLSKKKQAEILARNNAAALAGDKASASAKVTADEKAVPAQILEPDSLTDAGEAKADETTAVPPEAPVSTESSGEAKPKEEAKPAEVLVEPEKPAEAPKELPAQPEEPQPSPEASAGEAKSE